MNTRPGDKIYRIFFSAAEPSGDAHCAAVITALRRTGRSFELKGVGGPKMAAAGCDMIAQPAARAVMTYKAFTHVARYLVLLNRIANRLREEKFDLVVVCDSPSFNFHVAKAARKAGSMTLFYVAPQLWAWAAWRIGKLRRLCDRLACILPFEQQYFASRGVNTVFVGNPLLDRLEDDLSDNVRTYGSYRPDRARIAIMPGSRLAEIESLWVPMQRIAMRIALKYGHAGFVAVAANEQVRASLETRRLPGFQCEFQVDSVYDSARRSDFSIVASGSATLEVAAAGCPMVILYQSSRFLWQLLGRHVVKSRHLSLVNILAGRRLVPEFMPYFKSIDPVVESIDQLLGSPERLRQASRWLVAMVQPLHSKVACGQVCGMIMEMLSLK